MWLDQEKVETLIYTLFLKKVFKLGPLYPCPSVPSIHRIQGSNCILWLNMPYIKNPIYCMDIHHPGVIHPGNIYPGKGMLSVKKRLHTCVSAHRLLVVYCLSISSLRRSPENDSLVATIWLQRFPPQCFLRMIQPYVYLLLIRRWNFVNSLLD